MLNDFFITRDVLGFLKQYLEAHQLDHPNYRAELDHYALKKHISYEEWWSLLEELQSIHCCPALGLEIGRHVKVEHCGVLGYLLKTSRNIIDALACFKRFQRLIYAGSQAETELVDDLTLNLVWDSGHGYSSQLSDELLLVAMINIIRELVNPHNFNPIQISFTQVINKSDLSIYEDFFECEVHQNQKRLSISFSLEDLKCSIPHEDLTLHTILGKQAEELISQLPDNDSFLSNLRDTVIRCLHEGNASAADVASQLSISCRTLHRRLKNKNKIFRDILRDIRKSMAATYLNDDKLSLPEVALLLGYSEQSTFARAFKQWYGQSPLQYRNDKGIQSKFPI